MSNQAIDNIEAILRNDALKYQNYLVTWKHPKYGEETLRVTATSAASAREISYRNIGPGNSQWDFVKIEAEK